MEQYFKKIDKNYNGTVPNSTRLHSNDNVIPISPSPMESSSSIDDLENLSSNKRKRNPSYCKSWETDDKLKLWLTQNQENRAFCKYCNCELKAVGGIGDLYLHAKRKKHKEFENAIKLQQSSPLLKGFGNMQNLSNHNKQVMMAEIKLSGFCAEHNIPFLAMDHMVPMLQFALPDSRILSDVKCARTKTTAIVKNVIGETQLQDLINLMKIQPFSICIDESTDIATVKLLSIVVRIEYSGHIRDFFFALVKVEKCDADSLFGTIVDLFLSKGIDYKTYLIGFAADGASVMSGVNHSVATLLKAECPHLIIFKCVCHSFALAANYACATLPKFVEGTARGIYNFIQNSPKRISLFASLQVLLDYKPRKMLHPAQTRWLSLEATVNQLLSRLDVLKLFFVHEDLEKYEATDKLVDCVLNPLFQMYLMFLKFILNDINKLNRLFQSESPQIHRLNCDVMSLYTKILEYFIKDKYVEDVAMDKIPMNKEEVLKNISAIYVGADVTASISILNDSQQTDFLYTCREFYIELCKQLLKRFNFNNPVLVAISSISPVSVMNRENESIIQLCRLFPNLVVTHAYQNIDDEWREIRRLDFKSYKLNETDGVEKFWAKIFLINRGDGTPAFPRLHKLIMAILSIPISTANVERIFSQINNNKIKTRNRLDDSTLSGILLSKDFISKRSQNCVSFEASPEMLALFKSDMYEK